MSDSVVTRYVALGRCNCGGEEFYVSAVVKSHAMVYQKVGELDEVYIDTGDFHSNLSETDATLEVALDLVQAGHLNELPDRILDSRASSSEVDLGEYIVIRCSKCGLPFDYGNKRVVLGVD